MKLGRKAIEEKHPEIIDLLLRLRWRDAEHGSAGSYRTTRSYAELAEALRARGYATDRRKPLSKSTIGRLMHQATRSLQAAELGTDCSNSGAEAAQSRLSASLAQTDCVVIRKRSF